MLTFTVITHLLLTLALALVVGEQGAKIRHLQDQTRINQHRTAHPALRNHR